ncbi:uncharacterized protein LOC131011144 [Salvia miltiorrhiza]|uniref:uncharacterized protein LOC131011144 n=1 Tax=Salvia miltiorrhiza TaxID=226208 RepID=UPI0025AD4743|nr:uncharacterized protein LOC131011144 [Salvia miltiorrhiza]
MVLYRDFKPISQWTEDDQSHFLLVDLPGFRKEQLKVSINSRGAITVRGDRLINADVWSRFSEEYEIPHNSDISLTTAKFDVDILYITIPKKPTEQKGSETTSVRRSISREVSAVDPDSGSSSLCSGCRLPVFSTPSVSIPHGTENLFLHEQCARPPQQLLHELHPDHGLVLVDQLRLPAPDTTLAATCHQCRQICGTMLYQCPFMGCDFQLDLLCALQIKIVHRSHHHSLTAVRIRDSASLTCNACDTKHDQPAESEPEPTLSYLCILCGFWVHPDCASLPNAIIHYEDHPHSLFLTYNLPISTHSKCFICSNVPKRNSGVYFCLRCPNYLVHIRCALTRPDTFKSVFIREALVTDLGRLPLTDEHTSLIPYIRQHADATTNDYYQQNLHPHPLIFHKTDSRPQPRRVCNACVQFISPPFFTCSECPDFFLHSCCAHLPSQIQHRVHEEHPLVLTSKPPESDISVGFSCKACDLRCNGFAYSCKTCQDFSMDVVCALINPAITHESHDKAHILFMSRDTHFSNDQTCNCCSSVLTGICYECSICRNFKLHVRCALLPETVGHAFDDHPLKLTCTNKPQTDDEWCEICEQHLDKGHWFYSCSDSDQSFHVDCIHAVDRLSKIKLGSVVRVDRHGCPIELVRWDDGICRGRRCGFCGEIVKFSGDGLAYECRKCFFCTHHDCGSKMFVKELRFYCCFFYFIPYPIHTKLIFENDEDPNPYGGTGPPLQSSYPKAESIYGESDALNWRYPQPQSSAPYAVLGGGSRSHPQTHSIYQTGVYLQPQSTWHSAPYSDQPQPQPQSTWHTAPYSDQPRPQLIWHSSLYSDQPQPQSTWHTAPYSDQPRPQSTWHSAPYSDQPQPQPQPQSTWHTAPYSDQPRPQLTWHSSPYSDQPQPQSTWHTAPYSDQPRPQSTWHSAPYSDQPQPQSIWHSAPYSDQPRPQSTWHSAPYSDQPQPPWQSSSNPQPQFLPLDRGRLPTVADQQEISLATINNDEERIHDVAHQAINRPKIILDPHNAKVISKVERVVDPDGEGSSLCCACRLPIFSTPSISFSHGADKLFLHEKCECLPPQWLHELHPHQPLVLFNQLLHPPPPDAAAITCRNCKETCGAWFYHCPDPACDFQLDLLCVLQIKIVHRSHYQHAMTVIRHRESSCLTCSACGTKHESSEMTLTRSYLCTLCGYWIHPDCASLLSAILHSEKHQHSLFLTYNLLTSTDSKCSASTCSGLYKGSVGVFVCLNCTNYLVHINCALQNSHTFKPVFIRDAKASDLGRLPMANEHASLIPRITHDTIQSSSDYYDHKFHAHPLTFHQSDDGDQSCRVCNACVQSVSSLPFYSCSRCPDFFLHGCCAHLPTEIQHRVHQQHPLKLSQNSDISAGFSCKGCHLRCNGFAYSCESCDDFNLDVVCAMINPAITYEPHRSTHILFMSRNIQFGSDEKCNCCSSSLKGICYECSICSNFKLHVRCALLPSTIGHEFDQHPLQLTTKESRGAGGGDEEFCEVCEERIEKELCYYGCSECNQSFHVDCIPSVDRLSRIKLGANIRVDGHGCQLALVGRDDAVCGGRRCGSCWGVLNLCDDGLAYECSQCFFGLHQKCAKTPFVELKS